MNLWLSTPTFGKVNSMHMYAWKKGLKTDYTERDLSYIRLGPKCGVGGPGRIVQKTPMWEEDSY